MAARRRRGRRSGRCAAAASFVRRPALERLLPLPGTALRRLRLPGPDFSPPFFFPRSLVPERACERESLRGGWVGVGVREGEEGDRGDV